MPCLPCCGFHCCDGGSDLSPRPLHAALLRCQVVVRSWFPVLHVRVRRSSVLHVYSHVLWVCPSHPTHPLSSHTPPFLCTHARVPFPSHAPPPMRPGVHAHLSPSPCCTCACCLCSAAAGAGATGAVVGPVGSGGHAVRAGLASGSFYNSPHAPPPPGGWAGVVPGRCCRCCCAVAAAVLSLLLCCRCCCAVAAAVLSLLLCCRCCCTVAAAALSLLLHCRCCCTVQRAYFAVSPPCVACDGSTVHGKSIPGVCSMYHAVVASNHPSNRFPRLSGLSVCVLWRCVYRFCVCSCRTWCSPRSPTPCCGCTSSSSWRQSTCGNSRRCRHVHPRTTPPFPPPDALPVPCAAHAPPLPRPCPTHALSMPCPRLRRPRPAPPTPYTRLVSRVCHEVCGSVLSVGG